MYSLSDKTISSAMNNIIDVNDNIGGLICILSQIDKSLVPNKVYPISLDDLKNTLQNVFDISIKRILESNEKWYIVFAKNWEQRVFDLIIKNKIDILSLCVFFMRREEFEKKLSPKELVQKFCLKYNIQSVINIWFNQTNSINLEFNELTSEENQRKFYKDNGIEISKGALKFNCTTTVASSTELQRCAQIQTLYSGMDIDACVLLNKNNLAECYSFIDFPKKDLNQNTQKHSQIIYYGVPGSGKSHKIKDYIKIDLNIENAETQVIRTVFHPEYTNADFIGQILPEVHDKNIIYKFVPGPFSQILKKALLDIQNNYVLIIEEINRGNAAAIFGELFQLLDRLAKNEKDEIGGNLFTEGWSEYFVMNDNINNYIRDAVLDAEKLTKKITLQKKISFSANTGIRLPPNLSLLATMNTSDQNVFTLDNAFQRRWNMRLVENKFTNNSEAEKKQRNATIANSSITWEVFQTRINEEIAKENTNGLSSMEDKRIGCWFVKDEYDETTNKYQIKEETFKNKVLKYLWDDAFKFSHSDVFIDANDFENLLEKFSINENNFGIFRNIRFENKKEKKSINTSEVSSNAEQSSISAQKQPEA